MPTVVFRFRRPSCSDRRTPSVAMTEALQRLSQTPELQPLIAETKRTGKLLFIEVFHARDGQPILIHFSRVSL